MLEGEAGGADAPVTGGGLLTDGGLVLGEVLAPGDVVVGAAVVVVVVCNGSYR
jgi:hypothetical protein